MTESERKSTGSHFTPTDLAQFVARKLADVCASDNPSVLDPACGDGELLDAFLQLRPNSSLTGYDLDKNAVGAVKSRLRGQFEVCDFLEISLTHRDAELFQGPEKFDVVIANPPYVRTQVLGAKKAQRLASQFGLTGRVDIYFAFLEGIAAVLRAGGVAGIIVSNRFMTTRAGQMVRKRILENFDVLHIWDLGDTKLFSAAVLPAVLILRKKNGQTTPPARMTSIYTSKESAEQSAASPIAALDSEGLIRVGSCTYAVKHGSLSTAEGPWRIATTLGDEWLDTVRAHTKLTFGDVGKIRVGVKTTADKIFVKERWPEPRPEVIWPLISNDAARRYRSLPADLEILYTHELKAGKRAPINLDDYPKSKAYLELHREALTARKYVIEGGRHWYEIWVPHQPALWERPKLVFPDISEKPVFWLSADKEIIHGDCYWITCERTADADLLWLALAVGNSRFIEKFYDHMFHNKLYAGRRRFMTQYVEKFPLPDPMTPLAKEIVRDVKKIYEQTPSQQADKLAEKLETKIATAFGL